MKLSEILQSLQTTRYLKKLEISALHSRQVEELPVIVSFTSIPSRFHLNHLTIRSILNGSSVPEKIVLWLHESHEGKLPQSLTELIGKRFEVRFVSQDSPHLKLVRSLVSFPNHVIVTCDDDLLYERDWLKSLYTDHLSFPNDIIAHECRAIGYDDHGHVLPYSYWYRENIQGASYASLIPLGFGGVLYPPGCFFEDICDEQKYLQLTPKADDLWFKIMSYLKGTQSRLATKPCRRPVKILNSQVVNLRDTNINQDGNRIQWESLVNYYQIESFLPFSVNETEKVGEAKTALLPIDAVVTWVDGDDESHAKKLAAHLPAGETRPSSAAKTRFKDNGEISYCVASIFKHAPWIRNIYIVTDKQVPKIAQWMQKTPYAERVKVIDHAEIFHGFEHVLPTFNTRTISSMLWRIQGLSEQFLYMNDDFFFIKPVAPEDFFRDGKVVLRGRWNHLATLARILTELKQKARSMLKSNIKPKRAGYKQAQRLSAVLAGFQSRYFMLEHNPHPLRKSTLEQFALEHASVVENQLVHRFRSGNQYIVESLGAHLELANDNAMIDNRLHAFQMTPEKLKRKEIKWKLKAAKRDSHAAFACIQNIDKADKRSEELIFTWLKNQIGTL